MDNVVYGEWIIKMNKTIYKNIKIKPEVYLILKQVFAQSKHKTISNFLEDILNQNIKGKTTNENV